MEMLSPLRLDASVWPVTAAQCAVDFWNRNPPHLIGKNQWQTRLRDTLDIVVPDWAWVTERPCATHGDLTLCNTMSRVRSESWDMVFVDPVFPERVPQIAATDQARIVQSMLGWEVMTGFQVADDDFDWFFPSFLSLSASTREVVVMSFWVYVMMARIASSKSVTEEERAWAKYLRDEIRRALP